MAGMLQMRRSRGAASGFLLVLLGIWGAIIPFIGPYFHYAFTPDTDWTYTAARLWLEILPGAAVFLGGVLLMIATGRHIALFGATLAAAAGAWFALGTVLSPLWSTGGVTLGGTPVASTTLMRIMEQVGFFTGLGAVVILFAAMAIGRISAVSPGLREVAAVPATTGPSSAEPTEVLPVRNARSEETQTTSA
jgi:peptidoglycan/LPS O-acetylase OafA/YrhL